MTGFEPIIPRNTLRPLYPLRTSLLRGELDSNQRQPVQMTRALPSELSPLGINLYPAFNPRNFVKSRSVALI